MRLLFWKKKEISAPNVTQPLSQNKTPTTPKAIQVNKAPAQIRVQAVQPRRSFDPDAKELAPLKAWCDINLNPLAWSRVVIRMLPVFRDFDRNLSEMQKPGPRTLVENDLYMLILATIQEIYGVEPKLNAIKKPSLVND